MKIINLLFLQLAAVVAMCSCSEDERGAGGGVAQVNVCIDDFELYQDGFTRAAVEDACSRISFAVFNGATREKVFGTDQALSVVGEENFGKISFQVADGDYILIAVGYRVAAQTPTDTFAIIRSADEVVMPNRYIFDTFCKVRNISVNPDDAVNVNMCMERVISQFSIVSTDDVPENVCSISMRASRGDVRLNPTTGGGVTDNGVEKTIGVAQGAPFSSSLNMFVANKEQMMDIEIECFDEQGNRVMNKTLKNVVMTRSKQTIATGKLFSEPISAKLSVNDGWLEPNYINF